MSRPKGTHERLQEQALRLFGSRGFDNVTVEEIARAAGVSHMTFFRHFRTKEAVVLDDPYDPVIGPAVAEQDVALAALERVRRAVLAAWDQVEAVDDDWTRTRIRIAADHPGLRARIWQNNHRTEEVIVEALTATGVAQLEARVAAGAVLGALTAALLDWARDDRGEPLADRIRAALQQLESVGKVADR